MDKDKYYAELSRRLAQQGLRSQQQAGALEVLMDDQPACAVSPDSAVWLRPGDADSEAAHEAYHLVAREAALAYEYMNAIEEAPSLRRNGQEDHFKKLADFNGYVLAATEHPHGPQFVTWQWSYDHTYVTLGHYFGNNYAGAKEDFACRSGLVNEKRLFSNEQMTEMYLGLRQRLDDPDLDLSRKQVDIVEDTATQLEHLLPDVEQLYEQQIEQRQDEGQGFDLTMY